MMMMDIIRELEKPFDEVSLNIPQRMIELYKLSPEFREGLRLFAEASDKKNDLTPLDNVIIPVEEVKFLWEDLNEDYKNIFHTGNPLLERHLYYQYMVMNHLDLPVYIVLNRTIYRTDILFNKIEYTLIIDKNPNIVLSNVDKSTLEKRYGEINYERLRIKGTDPIGDLKERLKGERNWLEIS